MYRYQPQISVFDLVSTLSRAMDLIHPVLSNHHLQVAYISSCLARELGYDAQEEADLILAAAMHDIGALRTEERLEALQFDDHYLQAHAEIGYRFLQGFSPLNRLAEAVRYHHHPWHFGRGQEKQGVPVPEISHLIHLADRIAVQFNNGQAPLLQTEATRTKIQAASGSIFCPRHVEAFLDLSEREAFWLDLATGFMPIQAILARRVGSDIIEADIDSLIDFARFFARIVDFRSPMNATHSSGVAAIARMLAGFCGFSALECQLMLIAGYLHDLGKLAVPPAILEKPGKLNFQERAIVKSHSYYTYQLLNDLAGMDVITFWAAYHHERLDGKGYPFRITASELPLGSQIMSVADVYSAIMEDRPYREGMSPAQSRHVLGKMVQEEALNGDLVQILLQNVDEVEACRIDAQQQSAIEYRAIVH